MGSGRKASKTSLRSANLARPLIAEMLSGRRTAPGALFALKSLDTAAIQFFFQRVGHLPTIRGALLGKARVDTYQEIGTTPNPPGPVGPLAGELLLATHAVAYEGATIAGFVARRQAFEQALLVGDSAEARRELDAAEAESGQSIWLLEARVLHDATCLDEVHGMRTLLEKAITEARSNSYLVLALLTPYVREASARSSAAEAIQHVHQFAKDLPSVSPTTLASWLLRSSPAMLNAQHEEQLANFLHQESALPLVDRYLALRRTLLTLVSSDISPALRQAVRAALTVLARFVREPWVAYARAILGDEGPADGDDESAAMTRCLDLYTVGAYEEAAAASRAALATYPSRLAFYELHVRSVLRSGAAWTPPGPPGSPMHEVARLLYLRLQCKAETREALDKLEEQAASLTGLSLAEQLFRLLPESPERASLSPIFHLLVARGPTPRQLLAFGRNHVTAACMRRLRRQSSSSVALDVAAALLDGEERAWDGIPEPRPTKLRALAALADGRPDDALDLLDGIRELRSASIVDQQELMALRFEALLELEWIEECARVVAELYAGRWHLLVGLPLHRMRAGITHDRVQANPSIDWPLALLAAQKFSRSAVDSYDIYVGYDEYLLSRGCDRPSKLRAGAALDGLELRQLVLFLREACAITVMNHSPVFDSQRAVEQERIELCGWLIELDPRRASVYAEERDKIIRTQTIRDALTQVERSKIYVDTEGIRRSMATTLADRFAEIKELSRVERSILELVARQVDVGVLERAQVRIVERLFLKTFREVTKSFLSSDEHGLDGNLSIRIRHGTLTGQLRVHFERFLLVTQRDSRSGAYERNEHWLPRVPPGQAVEPIDAALRRFSLAVDRAIETVKDEWLQIRSPDKPNGLFNYDFSPMELRELRQRAVAVEATEAFGDVMFEALWRRTQENSLTVKQKIEGELRDDLAASLAELEGGLAPVEPVVRYIGLKSAIDQCRGGLHQVLESISGWFDLHATRVVQDHPLDLVAETCIAAVRRSLSRGRRLTSNVQAGLPPLRGRYFDHMLELMHILVVNAVRHGRRDADVRLEVGRDEAGLTVQVVNGLDPGRADELRARRHEYEQRAKQERPATAIRQEGGTGFYKLGKILRIDLGATDYDVALAVGDEELTTSVRISDKELLA